MIPGDGLRWRSTYQHQRRVRLGRQNVYPLTPDIKCNTLGGMDTERILSVKYDGTPTIIRFCDTPDDLTAELQAFGLMPDQVEWVQREDRAGRYVARFPGGVAGITEGLS